MISVKLSSGLALNKSQVKFMMGLYPQCHNFENPKSKASYVRWMGMFLTPLSIVQVREYIKNNEGCIPNPSSEQLRLLKKWGLV